MAMVVSIVNITDAPESKKTPTRLAIYTALLDPGEELKLPASMVDARLRKLESDGFIVIGQLPSWYQASKARKVGRRPVSTEELAKLVASKPKAKAKAAKGALLKVDTDTSSAAKEKKRISFDELKADSDKK